MRKPSVEQYYAKRRNHVPLTWWERLAIAPHHDLDESSLHNMYIHRSRPEGDTDTLNEAGAGDVSTK